MADQKPRDVLVDPIFDQNPVAVLVLGICSALAVSTTLENALVMTVSVMAVLVGSNAVISLIRNQVPSSIRNLVQISVIASLVIVVDQLLEAFAFDAWKQLSVFISLIVTNCIVMGRAEGFAMKNGVGLSLLDAMGNALGYGVLLVSVAFLRELFGAGRLFGIQILMLHDDGGWYVPNGLMSLAPGAFILIGLLIWALRSWRGDQMGEG